MTQRNARIALLVSTLALILWNAFARDDGRLFEALADLRYTGFSIGSLVRLLWMLALTALPYLPPAMFAVAALLEPAADSRSLRSIGTKLGRWTLAFLLGLGIAWCTAGIESGLRGWHPPSVIGMLLPTIGVLAGALIGDRLLLPPAQMARGILLRIAISSAVVVALGLGLIALAIDSAPLDAPAARITSADKRVLVQSAREHNPFRIEGENSTELRLTPADLSALLAWGATVFDPEARSDFAVVDNALQARAALRIAGNRYLNLQLQLQGRTESDGALQIDRCRLRIGSLALGDGSCGWLFGAVYQGVLRGAAGGQALSSLRALTLDREGLRATYSAVHLDDNARGSLRRLLGPSPAVRAGIDAQLALLRSNRERNLAADDPFGAILRSAFALAMQRSGASDAVSENQAAILALATVLGHKDVAAIGGFERPSDLETLSAAYSHVKVHRRDDWCKHFLVSAALTQISNALLSDAAGLLKEELDADGGSGFSFGDLQMDRAGTLFGEHAARSQLTARKLQRRLVDHYRLEDFAPPAADMPENLTDEEFQTQYGGVGGAGYKAVLERIEDRLANAPANAKRGD